MSEPTASRAIKTGQNRGQTTIAVSLFDSDRQWFKSCFGLGTRETSREVAFCAHVVHQKKEMIVQDTLLDDRFADNPLVLQGPRIRAYTGIPLLLEGGSCIGTFCAIDVRPREFNDAELAILRDLRGLALEEITRVRPPPGSYAYAVAKQE